MYNYTVCKYKIEQHVFIFQILLIEEKVNVSDHKGHEVA
jgi:hypothetical protein